MEFAKATEKETKLLKTKYQLSGIQHLIEKRTFFSVSSPEGRNIEFLKWLCVFLEEQTGKPYYARLFFDDNATKENYTAGFYIEEDKELAKKKEEQEQREKEQKEQEQRDFIRKICKEISKDNMKNISGDIYYNCFTENVYRKNTYIEYHSVFAPVYYGNFLLCYSPVLHKFYYRDYQNRVIFVPKNGLHAQ